MGTATPQADQPPEIAVTSVRIEKTKLDRFKKVAEANRRSVSQQMRWLIDQDIAAHPELRTDGKSNGGAA